MAVLPISQIFSVGIGTLESPKFGVPRLSRFHRAGPSTSLDSFA